MDLKRFFPTKIENNNVILQGDEFYHAVKVTRHKEGYLFETPIKEGLDAVCKIVTIQKDFLQAEIIETKENFSEPLGKRILFVGVSKELSFTVQKAVETGCTKIVPFYSERTNIKDVNRERLKKIALEAAKQCGRGIIPEISDAVSFAEAIDKTEGTKAFICYEESKENYLYKLAFESGAKDFSVFVGCEGGFSSSEIFEANSKGVVTATLGKRILRAETAAIVAITLINGAADER